MSYIKYMVIIHSNKPSKIVVGEKSIDLFYSDPILQPGTFITFGDNSPQYYISEVQYDMKLDIKYYILQDILVSNFGELAETMKLFEEAGFKFR